MVEECRVGYRTLAELLELEKEYIEHLYKHHQYADLVYHIEKYKMLEKEYKKND